MRYNAERIFHNAMTDFVAISEKSDSVSTNVSIILWNITIINLTVPLFVLFSFFISRQLKN